MAGAEVIATAGLIVSLTTVADDCVAELPAASVWFAVTETEAPSARAVTFRVVDHVSAEQVGVAETPPTLTETILLFSEQAPLTG